MPYEVFERRGSMPILIALLNWKKSEPMDISDIVKATAINRESVIRTITAFKEYNLVEDKHQKEWPFHHYVWLTALGQDAAQYMEGAARLLGHPKTALEPSSGQPKA